MRWAVRYQDRGWSEEVVVDADAWDEARSRARFANVVVLDAYDRRVVCVPVAELLEPTRRRAS